VSALTTPKTSTQEAAPALGVLAYPLDPQQPRFAMGLCADATVAAATEAAFRTADRAEDGRTLFSVTVNDQRYVGVCLEDSACRLIVLHRAEPETVLRDVLASVPGVRNDAPSLGLIGESAPMQRLRREIQTVARLDVPVLILGESGTGKELVARAIHAAGNDAQQGERPLVSLNLAALPATLIESELFGYAPGAFTGSQRQGQAGKLEQAAGGTVFLDEVADIPMEMQVKLLRVLEDHMVERLGSRRAQRVDFRLVSATNRDISELIDAGRFRLDLYYRLSGVVLRIPALRQRREDIPALLQHFVEAFCTRNRMPAPQIDHDVARHLAGQPWPGNVRQLRQRIEEALVFCDGQTLRVADFARGDAARNVAVTEVVQPQITPPADALQIIGTDMNEVAHAAVLDAIARHGGNKKRAAEQLRISRSHLYKILERGR